MNVNEPRKGNSPNSVVRLDSTESDPRFVAAYRAAIETEAAFDETLTAVGALPIPGGDLASARHLTMYLGTLFNEAHNASTQLAFMEMPRAQYIINRQMIEYYARNRWFLEYKKEATLELDLLQKSVYLEARNNPKAFDPAITVSLEQKYLKWAAANPDLDALKRTIPGITDMVRLSLDDPPKGHVLVLRDAERARPWKKPRHPGRASPQQRRHDNEKPR